MFGYSFRSWYGRVRFRFFGFLKNGLIRIFRQDPIGSGILFFGSVRVNTSDMDIMLSPTNILFSIKVKTPKNSLETDERQVDGDSIINVTILAPLTNLLA